jgi:1-aminocyclopropane-1-carboxylate synthase
MSFSSFTKNTDTPPMATASTGSTRGQAAVQLLPTYLADARAVPRYSPTCPDGALQLGVAETQLMEDWLLPMLNHHSNFEKPVERDCIYYQPTAGRESLRTAFATYVHDLLNLPPQQTLNPQGLIVGAGCNAVLENLCFCLAERGDAFLIPTPYYAAFEFDLGARIGLHVQPVTTQQYHTIPPPSSSHHMSPTSYYPNRAALDAAYDTAMAAGHAPRILLLSHPQNPLGICYPPHVVQTCIDWCRERQVHLISDEIYAGSVYHTPHTINNKNSSNDNDDENSNENETAPFVSALQLAGTHPNSSSSSSSGLGLGPYVHWVYALSKDFALSGLRVGVAYTENTAIQLPLQKLNDLCQISSTTQHWTEAMLQHTILSSPSQQQQSTQQVPWTTAFRHENHRRLQARAHALTTCLEECGIPYLPPTAGLFCWIDLSHYLAPSTSSSNDDGRERQLYQTLIHEFGLLLTPGRSMQTEQPGLFRCVFTAASDDEFALALERFRRFASTMRDRSHPSHSS